MITGYHGWLGLILDFKSNDGSTRVELDSSWI